MCGLRSILQAADSNARATLAIAIALAIVAGAALLLVRPALAQVPPHYPGTICLTQYFWCYAQPPGPVGSPCGCPTPYGWVPGVRG
jgi:hypothetical protein